MTFAASALADSPLGLWVMADYDDGTVPDISGNGHHATGTLVDVRPTGGPGDGLPGYAHIHLATNSLLTASPMHLPAAGAPFTIETWVRASAWEAAIRLCGNNVSTYGWWARARNTSGQLRLTLAGIADINSNAAMPVNTWVHVAMSTNRASGRLRFFVDGVEVDDAALPTSYNQTSEMQFSPIASVNHDRGVAATAIYDHELTPTRIEAHYAAALGLSSGPWSLNVNTVGSGAVSKDPDEADYEDDASVLLTATPASGWQFSGWSGALTGTTNPQSLVMDSDKTVTATFTEDSGPPPPAGERRRVLVIQRRVDGVWVP